MEHEPAAGYRPIEHTADVGLAIWGRSPEELFEQAALGMTSILVDPSEIRALTSRRIELESADREEGLISWLQEILYLFEVERFVGAAFRVETAEPMEVRGEVRGERLDPSRHALRGDLKAATYHDLRIRRTDAVGGGARWDTVIIFDV